MHWSVNKKYAHAYRTCINRSLRGHLNGAKPRKLRTPPKYQQLLGCTMAEFIKWIEKQWKPEWNWNNWGILWHIDHIIECRNYDLSDWNAACECFHYTNTRPFDAAENCRSNPLHNYFSEA